MAYFEWQDNWTTPSGDIDTYVTRMLATYNNILDAADEDVMVSAKDVATNFIWLDTWIRNDGVIPTRWQ